MSNVNELLAPRRRVMTMALVVVAVAPMRSLAQSNIDPNRRYGWAENVGWMNWRDAGGGNSGVVVGSTVLAGFIWAENVGWISVGDGTPEGGVHYANTDGGDFGVNIDPETGKLFGLAWGENIGWINFDMSLIGAQAARLDLCTKGFYGFAWGENIGWINLGNDQHYVASALEADCNDNLLEDLCDPDLDGDGAIDDCDDDIDADGIPNGPDACPYAPVNPPAHLVLADGSPIADLDGDCDVDLVDFAWMQESFTGPMSP